MGLTKRQAEVLNFIAEFIGQHNYAPSYRELMRRFRLASVATAYQHVENLRVKGYLKKDPHQARGIQIVSGKGRWDLAINLPLVGTIAAGEPIEAVEENETICVPTGMTT